MLLVALSLTEWVGLLLLVPLLALVGLQSDSESLTSVTQRVTELLRQLGIHATLPAVLVLFVLLVALRAFLQLRQAEIQTRLEQEFVLLLRRRLYGAIAGAEWAFLVRQRGSDFVHALTSEVDRAGTAVGQLLALVSLLIVCAAYVLVALRVSAAMTLATSVAGLLLVVVLRRGRSLAHETGERLSDAYRDLYATATEHLAGIKTARVVGAQERNTKAFETITTHTAVTQAASARAYGLTTAIFSVSAAVVLCIFVFAAVSVLKLSAASVLLLLLLFSRLVPRFSGVLNSYQYLITSIPSYAHVEEMIDRCVAAVEPHAYAASPLRFERAVQLREIGFRYLDTGAAWTLSGISLDIPARRTTAIVGMSGSGKSTLADLLIGLLTPATGTITIDSAPLDESRLRQWRAQIAYVSQDTFLLHDTIRANLLWAEPSATATEMQRALQQAAADEFTSRLPHGIDTVIGDRGVLLSGGERQRIALARALLRQPRLLILDEATSALDSENERLIRQAISSLHGQTTIVMITHRLSSVRDADRIHVLDGGRLVACGSWEELVSANSGRFRDMCAAQGITVGRGANPVGHATN